MTDTDPPTDLDGTSGLPDTVNDPTDLFTDLGRYVGVPRLAGLALSPAGDRLVTTVNQIDAEGGRYIPSVWSLDPAGEGPAFRLTRSEKGESSPVFGFDGSLFFISERLRPGGKEGDPAGIWRLAPEGGEPRPVATHRGGISAVWAAREVPLVVFAAKVAPGLRSAEDDETWRKTRADRKISAILHESLPVRHWDHDRGPQEVHLFVGTLPDRWTETTEVGDVRDLTPDAGQALHEVSPSISADGSTVVADWEVCLPGGRVRREVVRIDVGTGDRTVVAGDTDGEWSYGSPAISSFDGRVACLGEPRATLEEPPIQDVFVIDGPGGEPRRLDLGGLLWPTEVTWTSDGRALLVSGDLSGHRPLYRVDPDTGERTALATEGAWSSPTPAPDGSIYAMNSGLNRPLRPTRVSGVGASEQNGGATVLALEAPGALEVPDRLEEVTATADDGCPLRAWLVLPEGASSENPAPLVLWIHGGPYGSWNDWNWRWCPWVMAARGWAVLLPDPAFSTGYGVDFIRRGWGQWGGNPYTDLMSITDVAEARVDIDQTRTAAMGGSYGGYMANWIAGHTRRFSAIVSHASIWSAEQMQFTTDYPEDFVDHWGHPSERPEFYRQWSPETYVDDIATPMLVIHGNNDYRCPVSEGLRLWTALVEHGVEAKYLSLPGQNHWVLLPGDAAVWYETVLAFLDHHVLGRPWERPALL